MEEFNKYNKPLIPFFTPSTKENMYSFCPIMYGINTYNIPNM